VQHVRQRGADDKRMRHRHHMSRCRLQCRQPGATRSVT
jgi:hypothetical protein